MSRTRVAGRVSKGANEMGAPSPKVGTRIKRLVLMLSRVWAWVFLGSLIVFFVIAIVAYTPGQADHSRVFGKQQRDPSHNK